MAVDPDLAVTVDAIELHEDQPARVPLGYGERLAVPAHAAGKRADARSGGVHVAELPLAAPVVRQIQPASTGIVERRVLSGGDVAKIEPLGALEGEHRPLSLRLHQ